MLEIKQKGNRYYYFSRRAMRSFPIRKTEALEKIKNNEAYMVEYFITDYRALGETTNTEPVKPIEEVIKNDNVVNFLDKFNKKKEAQDLDKAKHYFIEKVMPIMKHEDKMNLLNNPEKFAEIMTELLLKAQLNEIKL